MGVVVASMPVTKVSFLIWQLVTKLCSLNISVKIMKGNKIMIREFNEGRDTEEVIKLEKKCSIGSKKGMISTFTNMMGDPLCRVRLYSVHVMLVAELLKTGKLVGMVRGCIKFVGTAFGERDVRLGCILGLRVSPTHRRMGIGLQLVQSMEQWLTRNGAHYFFLATEETNAASTNLFTLKCNYLEFGSLLICIQPVTSSPAAEDLHQHIIIDKLPVDQAISFYKNHLRSKLDIYPLDIDTILKENLSLGTWVAYIKEENRRTTNPSCWMIFSIWNTCEAYKLQVIRRSKSKPHKILHATIREVAQLVRPWTCSPDVISSNLLRTITCSSQCSRISRGTRKLVQTIRLSKKTLRHGRRKNSPCLNLPTCSDCNSLEKPFGFLFLFGMFGEGERVGEVMESVWRFGERLAENVKDCKAIMAELGASDPLREFVSTQEGSSISCINDLWYIKKVKMDPSGEQEDLTVMRPVGNVFVDPRDF